MAFLKDTMSKRKQNDRKQSLFERLRCKLKRSSSPSEDNTPSTSPQSRNAVKPVKAIGIGLMQYDESKGSYNQIRTKSGGGTRNVSISKQACKQDLLAEAKKIFFPGGNSAKFGSEDGYEFTVMDYQFMILEEDITVQEISDLTKLNNLRFYLAIRKRQDHDSDAPREASKTENLQLTCEVDTTTNFNNTETIAHSDVGAEQNHTVIGPEQNGEEQNDEDYLPSMLSLSGDTDSVHVEDAVDVDAIDNFIAELERHTKHSDYHTIRLHRGHVFLELKTQFKERSFNFDNDLFTFQMILPNGDSEIAEDNGGVVRDALVEFWDSFYEQCCLGRACKIPYIRHDYDNADWKAIASVLYFGWTSQKYFPIHIAKSFMSCCIYGMDIFAPTKESLIPEYMSFLPCTEADTLKSAMEGDFDEDEVIDILSSHECRVAPTKANLKKLVGEIAHMEFIQEPMYVKGAWFDQLVLLGFNLGDTSLETLYQTLIPNPKKVLKMLTFPESMSAQQSATSDFLKKFIRELEKESLARFLRFCTGADICLTDGTGNPKPLAVRFSTVTGLARRPVAHTCGHVLELPEQYDSYLEFRTEFNTVLKSDVWVMDFV